jgi:dCMP deaminase
MNDWKGSDFACGGSRYPDDFGGWSFENLVERKPLLDKWDKRFIKLARTVSEWSKDGTKVGAVLTRPDHSLVSVGFNGLIPGMDDALLADREFKNACIRHAEVNALWYARFEPSMAGYTMYIYGFPGPCGNCASAVAMAKITRMVAVYEDDAKTDWSKSIEAAASVLKAGKVKLEAYKWSTLGIR